MDDELEKLQGTWNMVSLEIEGTKMGPHVFKGSKIVVKGNQFDTISMGATYMGTVSVDPASTPKRLDVIFTDGPHQGHSALAIYELDKDTWKLCLGFAGNKRPEAFDTTAGCGHALEVLTRGT
jgi:uncharacterized protein (TIGR03067 family)